MLLLSAFACSRPRPQPEPAPTAPFVYLGRDGAETRALRVTNAAIDGAREFVDLRGIAFSYPSKFE